MNTSVRISFFFIAFSLCGCADNPESVNPAISAARSMGYLGPISQVSFESYYIFQDDYEEIAQQRPDKDGTNPFGKNPEEWTPDIHDEMHYGSGATYQFNREGRKVSGSHWDKEREDKTVETYQYMGRGVTKVDSKKSFPSPFPDERSPTESTEYHPDPFTTVLENKEITFIRKLDNYGEEKEQTLYHKRFLLPDEIFSSAKMDIKERDPYGRPIKEIETSHNGSIHISTTKYYNYDKHGNPARILSEVKACKNCEVGAWELSILQYEYFESEK